MFEELSIDGQFFASRAKGSAAGGVKSANLLRGRGASRDPPLKTSQDGAIYGHVLRERAPDLSDATTAARQGPLRCGRRLLPASPRLGWKPANRAVGRSRPAGPCSSRTPPCAPGWLRGDRPRAG